MPSEQAANDQPPPFDDAAVEAMHRDLRTVVEDLLELGEPRGKIRRMFRLSWDELDRGSAIKRPPSSTKRQARVERLERALPFVA